MYVYIILYKIVVITCIFSADQSEWNRGVGFSGTDKSVRNGVLRFILFRVASGGCKEYRGSVECEHFL